CFSMWLASLKMIRRVKIKFGAKWVFQIFKTMTELSLWGIALAILRIRFQQFKLLEVLDCILILKIIYGSERKFISFEQIMQAFTLSLPLILPYLNFTSFSTNIAYSFLH
ncbi:hypothetical protein ACJX0J_022413, partial [Zea mays]